MSVQKLNLNQIGNKLNIGADNGTGSGFKFEDARMSMNGSIFGQKGVVAPTASQTARESQVGQAADATQQGGKGKIANFFTNSGEKAEAKKEKETADKTADLTNQGNKATNEADSAEGGAKGATNNCKNISARSVQSQQKEGAMNTNLKNTGAKTLASLAKENKSIAKLDKENQTIQKEMKSLEAEKAALSTDDGTGSGENSAYSLKSAAPAAPEAPQAGGPSKAKGAASAPTLGQEQAPADSTVQQKSEEINAKLATLGSKSASNSKTMTSTIQTANNQKMFMNSLIAQAAAQTTTTQSQVASGTQGANVAGTIGTATTVVGGATTATGVTMTAFVPTSAPGALLTKVGIGVTGLGAATTGASSLAKGDLAGASQSADQLNGTATTFKSAMDATKIEKPKATTEAKS